MADAFITSGMKDAGSQYVHLDDCWMDGLDSSSKLRANSSTLPSGSAALAEYIRGKGPKIGIYETPNTQTCAGVHSGYSGGVGSKGHETQDARTFAEWGIDCLQYDECRGDMSGFAVMRDALRATGRPTFCSVNPADPGPRCTPTPTNRSIEIVNIANLWRIEFDNSANWDSVIRLIDMNKLDYVGGELGHWNDPDMLEVGNGLNDTDRRAHFSTWAITAVPLITGNDPSTMSANTKAILTNNEISAIDRDPRRKQDRVVAMPGNNREVRSKEMSGTNTRAVVLFNRGTGNASITVQWRQIGIAFGAGTVRDLSAGQASAVHGGQCGRPHRRHARDCESVGDIQPAACHCRATDAFG